MFVLYSASMFLTPVTTLTWAYQLHYYLCFRTHRRRPLPTTVKLTETVRGICERHDYHLLECQPQPTQLLCLLSLKPTAAVSKVIQTVKSNSSRDIALPKPVWPRGYLSRSVGRMPIQAVREYLTTSQSITGMKHASYRLFTATARVSRLNLNRHIVALNSITTWYWRRTGEKASSIPE